MMRQSAKNLSLGAPREAALCIALGISLMVSPNLNAQRAIAAPQPTATALQLTYPPRNHQTTAAQLFFIGSAPPQGEVLINNTPIRRSPAGHFAPSLPLQLGENRFSVRYGGQEIQVTVTRNSGQPETPQGVTFAPDSLLPASDLAKLPGEAICFSAIAPQNSTVSVRLGNLTLPLAPQSAVQLPPQLRRPQRPKPTRSPRRNALPRLRHRQRRREPRQTHLRTQPQR